MLKIFKLNSKSEYINLALSMIYILAYTHVHARVYVDTCTDIITSIIFSGN